MASISALGKHSEEIVVRIFYLDRYMTANVFKNDREKRESRGLGGKM